ncbi:hypothetical protein ACJJTC_010186 [Scirpophaga incertulas]
MKQVLCDNDLKYKSHKSANDTIHQEPTNKHCPSWNMTNTQTLAISVPHFNTALAFIISGVDKHTRRNVPTEKYRCNLLKFRVVSRRTSPAVGGGRPPHDSGCLVLPLLGRHVSLN